LALFYSETGDFVKAAELARRDEDFAFELGQSLLRRGDFAGALSFFEAARGRFPKSAQIELAYGVAAYGQRRFTDSIDAFLHVIRIDPSIEQPYVFLSRLLDQAGDRLGQITAAYAAWEKAAPGNCLPVCLHAKALSAGGGDPAEIEAELRWSIQLNDAYWESHFELGVLLAKSRRWDEAAAELVRGIELNPKHAAAHFQLARVYEKLGKPELARAERAEHQRLTAAETNAETNVKRALPGAGSEPIR
jgi:tetratricopeptide (TPR) repeat protein